MQRFTYRLAQITTHRAANVWRGVCVLLTYAYMFTKRYVIAPAWYWFWSIQFGLVYMTQILVSRQHACCIEVLFSLIGRRWKIHKPIEPECEPYDILHGCFMMLRCCLLLQVRSGPAPGLCAARCATSYQKHQHWTK
jgi:hypothetical protein